MTRGIEPNYGQWDPRIRFASRTRTITTIVESDAVVFARGRSTELEMRVVGGAMSAPFASSVQKSRSNYLFGTDPAKWTRNVPSYERVTYADVQPGIDLVLHEHDGVLEYDFDISPGADLRALQIELAGALSITPENDGALSIRTVHGTFRQAQPEVVERAADGETRRLITTYEVHGNRIAFDVAGYDPSLPLFIDPTIAYATYLGGSGDDYMGDLAVDATGHAYVSGQTQSIDFPIKDPIDGTFGGTDDGFLTKLDVDGKSVVFSTYFGGMGSTDGFSWPVAMAVDAAGDCYMAGSASSTFPTTGSPSDGTGVVVKLDPSGSSFLYAARAPSGATSLAIDDRGDVVVAGETLDGTFTPTPGALQTTFGGSETISYGRGGSVTTGDAFVAKLDPSGAMTYSTYLGGSGGDRAASVAIDPNGDAYVAGFSDSPNFPLKNALAPAGENFLAKIDPTGSSLVYSTFFSGMPGEVRPSRAIAAGADGSLFVIGNIGPDLMRGLDCNAAEGAPFVAKISPDGQTVPFVTYLAAKPDQAHPWLVGAANAMTLDGSGRAFLTIDYGFEADGANPLIAEVDSSGKLLATATLLPDGNTIGGYDATTVAVDPIGAVYVAGETNATTLPVTSGAFQTTKAGDDITYDPYVVKYQGLDAETNAAEGIMCGFHYVPPPPDAGATDAADPAVATANRSSSVGGCDAAPGPIGPANLAGAGAACALLLGARRRKKRR